MKLPKLRIPEFLVPAKRKKSKDQADWHMAILGVTLGISITAALLAYGPYNQFVSDNPKIDGYAQPRDTGDLIDNAMPSIVTIFCNRVKGRGDLGTGWAIDLPTGSKKYKTALITNHHVIERCIGNKKKIIAIESGGKESPVQIVKYDVENDLALLSTTRKLKPLPLSQSNPWPGYWVIALGSADGYEGSVAIGNVLNVTTYNEVLLTAALSHGNSGGPLLDNEGKVIGVNSWSSTKEQYNGAMTLDAFCAKIMKCKGKEYWDWG